MGADYEKDKKINVIKVLAKAAYDQDFYQKLSTDPKGTLNDEGIQGDLFYIPDEKALKAILCILECLGNIIEKRS